MLVNAKEVLEACRNRGCAIPAANFIDQNSAQAYVETAEEKGLPLILAFAQSHQHLLSLEEAAMIGKYYAKKASVPIILHLDHGEDVGYIQKAINLGFTSVMIDASSEDFERNITLTKEVVTIAHAQNVTVEAELGHVGSNEVSYESGQSDSIYTEVESVVQFIEATDVDSLAISIGTAHGVYYGAPKINYGRLHEIDAISQVPLVLHGGSSSGDRNLERCATEGISKINIYTDFIVNAYRDIQSSEPTEYASMIQTAQASFKETLAHYYQVFHSELLLRR